MHKPNTYTSVPYKMKSYVSHLLIFTRVLSEDPISINVI